MIESVDTVRRRPFDARTKGAVAAAAAGAVIAIGLAVAGSATTLVPVSIGLAIALVLVPFPAADRLLAFALVATMPLVWSDGLPNLPLAAAVIVIALARIAPSAARSVTARTWVLLALVWAPLLLGITLADWPPASVWLRPAALLGLGAVASVLGGVAWRDTERRERWFEGITLGLVVTAASGLVVFSLQYFAPVAAIVDAFADLQGFLRGTSAGETFRDQNNWLIRGERDTLRAISPLFPSPNNLGAYLGITMPIAFVQSLSNPSRGWRVVAMGGAALGMSLVVLTFSRSTWLATAISGVLMLGLIAIGNRQAANAHGIGGRALKLGAALAMVALLTLLVGASAGSTTVVDRVANPLGDESVTDRLDTNEQALNHITGSPLRGTGLGNWRAAVSNQDDVAYIHNVYLEYSAAAGLFGGLWALLVVAVPMIAGVTLLRARRIGPDFLLGAVVVAVFAFAAIHFLFDDNLLNPQYAWLLLWALGGSFAAAWGRQGDVPATRTA